jgi:hypothetical protein
MTDELSKLIDLAKTKRLSSEERAEQRISFAFGNGVEEADVVSKRSLKETDKMIRSQLGPKKR